VSVQAYVWAMGQNAGGPLEKLVLLTLADWAAMDGVWQFNDEKLTAFCECSSANLESAIHTLQLRGLLVAVGGALQIAYSEGGEPRRGTTGGIRKWSISKARRFAIYSRDGHCCIYCGSEENLSIDHIVPRSKGGTDDEQNLATACRSCNSSKRDRDLIDWRGA